MYFGFSIGASCQADNHKIPAQQQAVNVSCNLLTYHMSDLFTDPVLPSISSRLRLGTMLLDHALICFVFLAPIILIQHFVFPERQNDTTLKYWMAPVFVIYFCKDCFGGRSLAKRKLKLVVVDSKSYARSTPIQSVLRNLSIVIWPIEVLVSLFDQERRLGDKLAGTKLVRFQYEIPQNNSTILQFLGAVLIASSFTALLFMIPLY